MKNFLSICIAILCVFSVQAQQTREEQKAMALHRKIFTIDSHTDTPLRLTRAGFDFFADNSENSWSRVDYPRMKDGQLDAVFFAAFTGQGPLSPDGRTKAYNDALKICDSVESLCRNNPNKLNLCLTSAQALENHKKNIISIFLGMENAYPLGTDTSLLRFFYQKGIRYVTVCHTKNNDLCDSSTDTLLHDGLSDTGRLMIDQMNQLGIMVDVSHLSDKSFYDIIDMSKAPVIASHSCARAICDSPRNMYDEMLISLAANGGVIQLCILSDYVKSIKQSAERDTAMVLLWRKYVDWDKMTPEQYKSYWVDRQEIDKKHPRQLATISDAVDHIDHIVKTIGINHVGIGTDFDGGGGLADCKDSSELWRITLELIRRGYSKEDIAKIWGGNFLCVMREVEMVAFTLNNAN
ncbi:MAG: dipeptidase [Bacteroidales bacterium]|nr:dipeptidase [Bacteroidales bacterium]